MFWFLKLFGTFSKIVITPKHPSSETAGHGKVNEAASQLEYSQEVSPHVVV